MSNCIEWEGVVNTQGYGIKIIGGYKALAHHLVFESQVNEGYVLHHSCGNRLCVNKDHLILMSRSDHMKLHRSNVKKKLHCINGHKYTEENTYNNPNGSKDCKVCKRLARKRYKTAIREKEVRLQ